MRLAVFLILFFVISFGALSQIMSVDSLKKELAKHPQPDTIRVAVLNNLAFENHYTNPDATLRYAEEARELSLKLNFPKGVALSYRQTGLALWSTANFSDALDYFLRASKIADSLHLRQVQADLMGNIGLVYNGLGNYNQALTFFESSARMQRELKNKGREAIMLNNMGDSYFHMKDYDGAMKKYRESLVLGATVHYLTDINHRNIGNVFEATGNLDSALAHYKLSFTLSADLHGRQMVNVRNAIASVQLKKGNYKEAETNVIEAIKIAAVGKYRAQLRDSYALLSDIERAQGRLALSLDHYKKSIAYRDSVQNLTETSRIASIRLEYEIQKKQMEISRLKTDTELQEKDLSLKNTLLYLSIASVVLLAFFIYFMVKTNQLLKTRNAEISEQQTELLALNDELSARGEEVSAQRDALFKKNAQVEQMNRRMAEINENLEQLVRQRTTVLEEQNKRLSDYAFFNAHKLRAPLARVMGLVNLLMAKINTDERPVILNHLKNSSEELDSVVRGISNILQDDKNVSSEQGEEK
jgi:tetratricopeptide (TPR) repeat protein